MAEDMTTYTNAVLKLEDLIGKPHGHTVSEIAKAASLKANSVRWGKRQIDIDICGDQYSWTIRHKSP